METPESPDLLPLEAGVDRLVAGGKAVGLARLLAGGLPVPPGFIVTCAAFRRAQERAAGVPPVVSTELAQRCVAEWQRRGSPPVAVRSSATIEDTAGQSMAGRFVTVVGVTSEEALVAAIESCWRSLPLTEGVGEGEATDAAMAVIVQRIVPADVAGVVFTADPATGDERVMILEASWGLGEAVVSGLVQPDRLVVATESGRVEERITADKESWIPPGGSGPVPVPEERRRIPCLEDSRVQAIRELVLTAARLAGQPQDVEFAIEGDRVWLLQSRDITTLPAARARAAMRETLTRAAATLEGGPWVAHNLGETLRHPTPFTWDVMRRFMSGDGGFGDLYRRVGFEPSPRIAERGFLELIGGRVHADTSRAADIFFANYPYTYDLELLRRDPGASQLPPTIPTGSAFELRATGRRLASVTANLRLLASEHHRRLEDELVPAFEAWCVEQDDTDLHRIPDEAWHEVWMQREERIHREFAPESLLPSLIVGLALADLRELLDEHCWREDRRELLNQLAATPQPDRTVVAVAELRRLARGEGDREEWMISYGHRAPDEMDLATPRWRETPDAVQAMIDRLAREDDPLQQHERRHAACAESIERLRARLPAPARVRLDATLATLHTYMHWREEAKHALLRGHDLLRRTALDAGRRLGIGEDVFLLTPLEVRAALAGAGAPADLIEARRLQRRAEAELSLPQFLDRETLGSAADPAEISGDEGSRLPAFPLSGGVTSPDEVGALGSGNAATTGGVAGDAGSRLPAFPLSGGVTSPDEVGALGSGNAATTGGVAGDAGSRLPAFPLSGGVGTGPVRKVRSPGEAGDLGSGYVLVCPSTDPAWTPLLAGAAALVLERGGTLSHGAIVAREMGVPAVVLDRALGILEEGEEVTVDGGGAVLRRGERPRSHAHEPTDLPPGAAAHAPRMDDLEPPPLGQRERLAARLTAAGLVGWGLFLAACWLLPASWLWDPCMAALDATLWPLVRALGMPGATAAIAAGLAALSIVGQRLLTDNERLVAAKERAALATQHAAELEPGSARRRQLESWARAQSGRLFLAAMTPLALGLGPMICIFLWCPARLDPASWRPAPGAPIDVVAQVASDVRTPVTLRHAEGLSLDWHTPAEQQLQPIRETLEELRDAWRTAGSTERLPADLRAAAARSAGSEEELQTLLAGNLPPQQLSWRLTPTTADDGGPHEVTVTTAGHSLTLQLVQGRDHPPTPTTVSAPGDALLSLEALHAPPVQRRNFWQPLAALGLPWDAGWLGTYLLAYLPVMFLMRRLLGVA